MVIKFIFMNSHMPLFELKALAYTNLIQAIYHGDSNKNNKNEKSVIEDIPNFSSIRCICGNNENFGELVICSFCHCRLHANCIDQNDLIKSGNNYKCPFCLLQTEGIDPFKELSLWIEDIDSELRDIHHIIQEASNLEDQIDDISKQLGMNFAISKNYNQMISSLSNKIQELMIHINKLEKI